MGKRPSSRLPKRKSSAEQVLERAMEEVSFPNVLVEASGAARAREPVAFKVPFPHERGRNPFTSMDSWSGDSERAASLASDWIETHLPVKQIEDITALATAVLENEDAAVRWLREPNIALDNKRPIELLGTEEGFQRIKSLLMRIEYGVLA